MKNEYLSPVTPLITAESNSLNHVSVKHIISGNLLSIKKELIKVTFVYIDLIFIKIIQTLLVSLT